MAVAAMVIAGCGSVPPTERGITMRGAINATYSPGAPGSCGPGDTLVTGLVGPDRQKDYADLTVSDSGHLTLQAPQLGGTFSGTGVSFRPGSGWDIDAVVRSSNNQTVSITGHLGC